MMMGTFNYPLHCDDTLCTISERGGSEACEGFVSYSSTSGMLSVKLDDSPGIGRNCSFLIMPEWFYSKDDGQPPDDYTPVTINGPNYDPTRFIPPPVVLAEPSIQSSVMFMVFMAYQYPVCNGALVDSKWVLTTATCCERIHSAEVMPVAVMTASPWLPYIIITRCVLFKFILKI